MPVTRPGARVRRDDGEPCAEQTVTYDIGRQAPGISCIDDCGIEVTPLKLVDETLTPCDGDSQPQARKGFDWRHQQPGQYNAGERRNDADPVLSLSRAGRCLGATKPLHQHDGPATALEKCSPHGSEGNRSSLVIDESNPQAIFQTLNSSGERRLTQMQPLSGSAHGPGFRDRDKGDEFTEFHLGSHPTCMICICLRTAHRLSLSRRALVDTEGEGGAVPAQRQYREMSRTQRLERLARTPHELAGAIGRHSDQTLSRRPDAHNWAAKEVVCHLRDIEEVFMLRFYMMIGTRDPIFLVLGELPPDPGAWGIEAPLGMPLDPDRWAEERQYLRNDVRGALTAFGRRREELLIFLKRLSPEQWTRGSTHVTLGRMTFDDWTALIAAHDDKHLSQLVRALDGQP